MSKRCGLPDFITLSSGCAAPIKKWRVSLPGSWNGRNYTQLVAIWSKALKLWTDQVDLSFDFVQNDPDAELQPAWGRIDSPGNVLAWSELPCPWSPPINQRYDSAENWSDDMGIDEGISLPLVIAHETGHALGLGHGPRGSLMAPYIDSSMTKLSQWDIDEIKARYGSVPPPTNGGDTMANFWKCLITVLPTLLSCLFQTEKAAREQGKDGPIEELQKYADTLVPPPK